MKSTAYQLIALWGAGWAVAMVLLPIISIGVSDSSSSSSVVSLYRPFLIAIPIGIAAIGIPVYVSGHSTGARHPRLESIVWVLTGVISTVLFVTLPKLGASSVNAVTFDDISRRNEYYKSWHYPRELVRFLWCLVTYSIVCGTTSALLELWPNRKVTIVVRAFAFSACIAGSVGAGLLIFVIATSFLMPFAMGGIVPGAFINVMAPALPGFCGGFVAGAGILLSRRFVAREPTRPRIS